MIHRQTKILLGLATAAVMALGVTAGCAPLKTRTAPAAAQADAPGFELAGNDGATHTLAEVIDDGVGVVLFYRGFW